MKSGFIEGSTSVEFSAKYLGSDISLGLRFIIINLYTTICFQVTKERKSYYFTTKHFPASLVICKHLLCFWVEKETPRLKCICTVDNLVNPDVYFYSLFLPFSLDTRLSLMSHRNPLEFIHSLVSSLLVSSSLLYVSVLRRKQTSLMPDVTFILIHNKKTNKTNMAIPSRKWHSSFIPLHNRKRSLSNYWISFITLFELIYRCIATTSLLLLPKNYKISNQRLTY